MPPVSKRVLNDEVLVRLFSLFFEIVGKQRNQNDFDDIIFDVLSPVEKVMIAKRIAIYYLLLKKKDYLSICNTLKVSAATVAKFKYLLDRSERIIPSLKKVLRNEQLNHFIEELLLNIKGPGSPGVNWTNAWNRKLDYEKRKSQGI